MRTADAYSLFTAFHQLTEQPCAFQRRDTLFCTRAAFWIALSNCGSIYNKICTLNVFSRMADMNLNALFTQRPQQVAVCLIGTRNTISLFQQHACQARHA